MRKRNGERREGSSCVLLVEDRRFSEEKEVLEEGCEEKVNRRIQDVSLPKKRYKEREKEIEGER